eukprot:90046-Chlamydomonas_euryale.AAC.1
MQHSKFIGVNLTSSFPKAIASPGGPRGAAAAGWASACAPPRGECRRGSGACQRNLTQVAHREVKKG